MTHTRPCTALFIFAALLLLPAYAVRAQNLRPQAASQSATEERVFRGYVDRYDVRVRLRRAPGGELSGSYSYEGRTGSLTLKGSVDAKGDFTLEEFDGAKKTGTFKGQWEEKDYEPEARLSGEWKKPTGGPATYFYFVEQPAPAGGLSFTTKQVKEKNKQRGYEVNVEYPQFEGAAQFNRLAESFAAKEVSEFKREAGRKPGEKDFMPEAGDDSLNVRYYVRSATPELVSVEFAMSYYEHGAAHPSHAFHVINYDAKSGRELKLADLFKPGSDYLKKISEVAIKQLRRWNTDSAAYPGGSGEPYLADEGIVEGAKPAAENFKNWTITPRGLAVTFDYYQVGPYAAGAQSVILPYADLEEIIRPGGPLDSLAK